MTRRRLVQAVVLTLVLAIGQLGFADDPSGEWVGQMMNKTETAATAPLIKVTLKSMGSRLSGMWGSYTLTGSIEEGHVELMLSDASGAMIAQMRGRVGDGTFYGNGSVQPPPGSASGEWTAVSWTLRRPAGK